MFAESMLVDAVIPVLGSEQFLRLKKNFVQLLMASSETFVLLVIDSNSKEDTSACHTCMSTKNPLFRKQTIFSSLFL